ncbi:response regulator [Natronospora cellulosivora (SeqCode)]
MKNEKIKVLLVDDHSVVRFGIKAILENTDDIEVCAEAESLEIAYQKVRELMPDVVLLDMKLADGDGVMGSREIKEISPETKIIILTAYGDESLLVEVIKAGANGYLLKDIDSKTILSSIRDVFNGKAALGPKATSSLLNLVKNQNKLAVDLSSRERNILDLLTLGKSNKDIAKELFIAEKTVRNYVSKIMKKINVSNRTEAALFWKRQKSLF